MCSGVFDSNHRLKQLPQERNLREAVNETFRPLFPLDILGAVGDLQQTVGLSKQRPVPIACELVVGAH